MKIRIISPYFLGENGTLPQHFQLYLNSCERNPEFELVDMENDYFVVPNTFAKDIKPEIEQVRKLSRTRLFYKKFLELKWNGLKNV